MWPSPRRWLLAHTTAKLPATHSASVSAARRPPLPSVPPAPALAWPPPCREISDCIARPHVRIALNYYNFNHPGAEFDCVRPLSAYFASFGGQIWSHVNFLARRRGCIDAPVLRFFAELFYYGRLAETPVVVSCTILRDSDVAGESEFAGEDSEEFQGHQDAAASEDPLFVEVEADVWESEQVREALEKKS
ncbi:uncharacterized protein [Oryza sativa Japonica Group]|uniref:uncharacterized protein isoform X2 n=1 Tax=Oryza sativa subsp. japonica TaxID=39947 RepID=UPI00339C4D03